ncbi:MAG: tape measure protein [Tannerella sp.]|jgi:tape measure domain-containing protein|nr:tape measure protein [Tannerella sp.]
MAGKLSFSIALNFLTENFKKGTNQAKAALRSLQMQVLTFAAALGAGGLGLTNFVSRLISTARETSRVTTALKNVSASTAQFADSQRFLLDMSKKYGMEINSLTGNFARFTASASQAGMSMLQQRKIFESVSRATTAFSLSADESNGVFLALSQMMSKGKISSEELRLQMGEKLPIALQAMAKAAGVSVAGLDSLMKKGQLMSADILPKFAEALDEMIPNIDTDNIETSLNRLQNAFTEFTKSTNVQSAYKQVIDYVTKLVEYAANNIRRVITQLIAFITGVSLGKMFKWIIIEIAKAERAALVAAKRAAKEAGIQFDKIAWEAQKTSTSIKFAFQKAATAIKTAMMAALPTAIFTVLASIGGYLHEVYQESKRIKTIFSDWKREAAGVANSIAEVDKLQRLQQIAINVNNTYEQRKGAIDQINGLLNTSFSIDQKTLGINGDINDAIKTRIGLLKDMASIEFFQKSKLEAESQMSSILNKYGGSTQEEKGTSLTKSATLSKNPFYYTQSVRDLKEYNQNYAVWQKANAELNRLELKVVNTDTNTPTTTDDPILPTKDTKKTDLEKAEEKYAEQLTALTNLLQNKAISEKEYTSKLRDLNKETFQSLSGLLTPGQAANNPTFQQAKSGVDPSATYEAEKQYSDKLQELSNQFERGIITKEEQDKAIYDLTESTRKEIAAMQLVTDADRNFLNALNERANELREQTKLDEIQKDYNNKFKELTNQRAAGLKTEEKYNEELNSLIDNTKLLAASLLGANANTNKFYNSLSAQQSTTPKAKQYDYRSSASEIIGNKNLSNEEKYNALQVSATGSAKSLLKEVEKEMSKATSLEKALKIAEAKRAIKDFSKELAGGAYDGIKGMVSDADRVVNAWSNLAVVFNDVDASEWEKIMAVWDSLTSTVDAFIEIIDMIKKMTEMVNMLSAAKRQEAIIDSAVTAQKLTNASTQIATDAAVSESTASANRRTVLGNTAAAASGAAKSVSMVPIVGVALAIAAVAGIIALLAGLPKFANGGIVGGNSRTGDKLLARVNSGELILNQRQQSALLGQLNGEGYGRVEWRLRGKDLEGVRKNYNKKRRHF